MRGNLTTNHEILYGFIRYFYQDSLNRLFYGVVSVHAKFVDNYCIKHFSSEGVVG
jgi:hypothetical protein